MIRAESARCKKKPLPLSIAKTPGVSRSCADGADSMFGYISDPVAPSCRSPATWDSTGARPTRPDDAALTQWLAEILVKGNVAGRSQGRTEFGPRVLGDGNVLDELPCIPSQIIAPGSHVQFLGLLPT